MYQEGKGKDKNLLESANACNEALKYDPNNVYAYYSLARAYLLLNRYDDSIDKATVGLTKTSEKNTQSDFYVVMGNVFFSKRNFPKAKESYQKALDLNPSNEYAKTNLANL